jgi:hypothetical protein
VFTAGQQGASNGVIKGICSPVHIYPSPDTSYLNYLTLPVATFFNTIQGNINIYDPVENYWPYWNAGINFIRYVPNLLTQKIVVQAHGCFVWWATAYVNVQYVYEASPIAVIPLDYSEYVKYPELRRVFGYSANGVDQPGWNSDDMIRVLRELFPDRAWMVYDDGKSTLYLWNVNFVDIPDWLLQKLGPTSAKVLKSPSSLDAEKSLFTELESRNYVIWQTA